MTTKIIEARTLQVIATEIKVIKNQAMNAVLSYSIEIGKRLTEAKEQVVHGEWGKWLEENVDYSQSQANKLMQVYSEYGNKALNSETIASLDYSKALALISVPEELRETFIETHDVENMSTREMKQAISTDKDIYSELERVKKEKEKAVEQVVSLEKEIKKVKESGPHIDFNSGEINDFDSEQVSKLEEKVSKYIKKVEKMDKAAKKLVDPTEHAKIKKLLEAAQKENEELKGKSAEVKTVNVIPPEVTEELERLKSQLSEGQEIQMLDAQFGTIVLMLSDLKDSLYKTRELDCFEKYRNATVKGLEDAIASLKDI